MDSNKDSGNLLVSLTVLFDTNDLVISHGHGFK